MIGAILSQPITKESIDFNLEKWRYHEKRAQDTQLSPQLRDKNLRSSQIYLANALAMKEGKKLLTSDSIKDYARKSLSHSESFIELKGGKNRMELERINQGENDIPVISLEGEGLIRSYSRLELSPTSDCEFYKKKKKKLGYEFSCGNPWELVGWGRGPKPNAELEYGNKIRYI